MPEDPKEEHKETPETQGTQATANGAPTAEELAAMKAELDEEKKAIAAAQTMITEKDARIAELQAEGEALRAERSNLTKQLTDLTQLKEAHTKAVAKYLDAVKLANTSLPGDVIAGATIEEIDASVARAQAIAESVKKSIEAQARQTRVPAGAPPRGEISLEGLSPREKIAAGIQQKGGTS
jgi:predicted nuclease with TOPRIM domain